MLPETVVVSFEEISQVPLAVDTPQHAIETLKSPIPLSARFCMSVLVLFLPVLAVVTLILRVAFRGQPRNVRFAWVSFTSTLLIISGLLSTAAAGMMFAFTPLPAIVNEGLPDLDERSQFTALPARSTLSSSDASAQLKPLVVVVSPVTHLWEPSGRRLSGVRCRRVALRRQIRISIRDCQPRCEPWKARLCHL
jgi:hypothetical protein